KSKELFSMFSRWDSTRPKEAADEAVAEQPMPAHWQRPSTVHTVQQPQAQQPPPRLPPQQQVQQQQQQQQQQPPPLGQQAAGTDQVFAASAEQLKALEAAILEQPGRAVRKKVPSLIWRVFYREIRELAGELKRLQGRGGGGAASAPSVARLQGRLAAALAEAEASLQRLCSAVQRRVSASEAGAAAADEAGREAPRLRATLRAQLQCLGQIHIMLADIERYRFMHSVGDPAEALNRAQGLYCSALEA
ncbi:unnamed protein product, partial [Prorocentrum cordatum]